MARVIRSNRLTTQKIRVRDAYDGFLRIKNSLCAKSTCKIYEDLGNRIIIPGLETLTDDDMNAITVDVIRSIIDDYAADHDNGGVTFLYRHTKAFINWFWDEYDMPGRNPMSKVKVKKVALPPKHGISREEVDLVLKAAKDHSNFPERDIAMLMILCDTGIRRSSLAGMKMKDVDIARSEMIVFEKDQQFHTKAFGSATCKALKKYLMCLTDIKPEDPFWLCLDGKALTYVGMREVLRRLCKGANIPMHHFHDFRRFYALELYNSTHDIYMVSRALDHKDIVVTKRYLAIDDKEDAENARLYSPMDARLRQTGVKVNRK